MKKAATNHVYSLRGDIASLEYTCEYVTQCQQHTCSPKIV
jgi:hypothetical protein